LTDEAVTAIAHHCPLVLEFDLQNLPGMTDKSMREVWLHSVYLRELRLTGNETITAAGFPALDTSSDSEVDDSRGGTSTDANSVNPQITDTCRRAPTVHSFAYLRTVDLTGCTGITDEAIALIIGAAPKIRALTLAKCIHLTDVALESVAKLGKQLHYLHAAHLSQ
jgi:F-box and leucine-rich repeat protein GRR1